MIILKESPEKILSTVVLQKNKLQNMKRQLEILLQKKIRLDTEIKILKKSIKKKSKSFQFSLKSQINLEAYDENQNPTSETQAFIEAVIPEAIPYLVEYDQLLNEIDELLFDNQEE